MNGKYFSVFLFVFLMLLAGAPLSFAQDDSSGQDQEYNSADDQARQDEAQKTLDEIRALALKMQENEKRLDALENAVDQATLEENPRASSQEVPAPSDSTSNETVQLASAAVSPQDNAVNEIKAEPVDVLPQAVVYSKEPMTSDLKENTFEIAQEDFYSSFKESGSHSGSAGLNFIGFITDHKASGGFYGIKTAYTYRPLEEEMWPINVFHIEVHGDYGVENYDYGADDYNKVNDPKLRNINDYIVEPKMWAGKDFNFGMNTLTPYLGIGYRWFYEGLKNKIEQSIVNNNTQQISQVLSNNIQTQYLYIPLGAQLSVRPTEGWRIDVNGEYDYLVWGRVTQYPISDSEGFNFITTHNTLKEGYGLLGSVRITKEEQTLNYFVEPYIHYWSIDSSKVFDTVQQDKNSTTEIGASLGIEF